MTNFGSNPLICDLTLFPGKNSPNTAKNHRAFPGKRKEDRAWNFGHLRLKLDQK